MLKFILTNMNFEEKKKIKPELRKAWCKSTWYLNMAEAVPKQINDAKFKSKAPR